MNKGMGAQKWYKFYGQEYLSDPKIERLSPTERSCWVTLLCMASLTEGKIRFLTVQTLLTRSGVQFDPYHPEEWEQCLGVLQKFEELEMITCHENGDITLSNWEKRQETNLTDAERAKSYRDRKKERHDNVTEQVTKVTQDKSRVDKSRVDKKDKYGVLKNVLLSEDEHTKLKERYGNIAVSKLVDQLSTYMESKGQKYKDHYATILNWAKRKELEELKPVAPPVVEVVFTPEQVAANLARAAKVKEVLRR